MEQPDSPGPALANLPEDEEKLFPFGLALWKVSNASASPGTSSPGQPAGRQRSARPIPEWVARRSEDRHRYIVLDYESGLQAPSWLVSDGTLRMLALTILAYIPSLEGVYLIEEPENGIHPRAVETVLQSLSSVYSAQVLLATHSPVILSLVQPELVLCPQGLMVPDRSSG
ncbi:ATP-binding protein [Candidatus Amarolinea dominans]|uniref:AAA family ATPase n=1 Tax=Candidatus Amarolinea dominans TaxID=3140696 RepID=UPI0031CC4BE3